jgi:ketosteroid isomerase-like protein
MTSNIELVQSLYAAFAAGDREGVRAGLSQDVQYREPDYTGDGGVYSGRDAVIAHLLEGDPLVEDYRLDVVDMLTSEHRVAIVAVTSGLRGGQPIRNEFVQVVTLEGDQVSAIRNYMWDPQTLRDLMAASPGPGVVAA